jgi:hypothetical protein
VAIRSSKPFQPLTAEAVAALPGQLGVFELADDGGVVRRIGYAGGRSAFGVRSELAPFVGRYAAFRWESTSSYLSRYAELLMVHAADHDGALPADQPPLPRPLGRLSPL